VRGRLVTGVVAGALAFSIAVAPVGLADETVPSKADFRPSLGWTCFPDRVAGDFDGDGVLDHAVVWDRVERGTLCDEYDVPQRWHLALLLSRGGRVQRALPCRGRPGMCGPSVGDLDRDEGSELFVEVCCGVRRTVWSVYQLREGRLVPPLLLPTIAAGLRPGPLMLRPPSIGTDSRCSAVGRTRTVLA
jgi:hypothetical protein